MYKVKIWKLKGEINAGSCDLVSLRLCPLRIDIYSCRGSAILRLFTRTHESMLWFWNLTSIRIDSLSNESLPVGRSLKANWSQFWIVIGSINTAEESRKGEHDLWQAISRALHWQQICSSLHFECFQKKEMDSPRQRGRPLVTRRRQRRPSINP